MENILQSSFRCLSWSFRPFGVGELASAFLFVRMYQIFDLATTNVSVSVQKVWGFFCFFPKWPLSLALTPFQMCSKDQIPNANSAFRINSMTFINLISNGKIRKQATSGQKLIVGQLSNYFKTSEGGGINYMT